MSDWMHVYESALNLQSILNKKLWIILAQIHLESTVCVTVCVTCTHFLSQASSVTVKPGRDLAGRHEEQTVKVIKLETGLFCYKILNVSLTDNYLKSLTGSLLITITSTTNTTPKLQCVFPTSHQWYCSKQRLPFAG